MVKDLSIWRCQTVLLDFQFSQTYHDNVAGELRIDKCPSAVHDPPGVKLLSFRRQYLMYKKLAGEVEKDSCS